MLGGFQAILSLGGGISALPAQTSWFRKEGEEDSMTTTHVTIRQPSAFLPIAMSLIALALVLGRIAFVGVAREADEGSLAHTWQLLMAAQLPIILYFALRYLPRQPKPAALVLALQVIAVLAACAPVFLLHW